jgi:hypothetical protein
MITPARLLVASAAAISLAALALVPAVSASPPQTGALHIAKDCSNYTGAAGDYCTIVSSNVDAIKPASRVYYLEALQGDSYDGDVMLYAGRGNAAFGHCKVNYTASTGRCIFTGGVGRFRSFFADVAVSADPTNPAGALWNGTYIFGIPDNQHSNH